MSSRVVYALVAIGVVLGVAACSENEDEAYWEETMSLSRAVFEDRFIESQAIARDVTESQVEQDWDDGASSSTLNSGLARYKIWFDWSTDFCSNSPDTGPHFDFKQPCARHDWGWRNLKRMDQHWNCAGSMGHPDPDLAKWCGNWPYFGSRGLPLGEIGAGWWTFDNAMVANEIFDHDMKEHCDGRSIFLRPSCHLTRSVYKAAVDEAAAAQT